MTEKEFESLVLMLISHSMTVINSLAYIHQGKKDGEKFPQVFGWSVITTMSIFVICAIIFKFILKWW